LAHPRERLVEIEGAEALLVPLGPREERDEQERREHEDVPLPPGDLAVPRIRDDHHRLGEQHESEGEGEHEPLLASTVEPEEAERGDAEERAADRGEDELPAVELLGEEWIVERRELGERDNRPGGDDHDENANERRRGAENRLRAR